MNEDWLRMVMTRKSKDEIKSHISIIKSFQNDKKDKVHTVAEIKNFLKGVMILTSDENNGRIVIAAAGGAAAVTPEAVSRLIRALVARYLRQWFTNPNNPRCTLYEFSNYGYMHPSDAKYTGEQKLEDNSKRKVMETAMQKQRQFQDLRLGQILQDPKASIVRDPGKQKYDYLNLAWVDQYCSGYLDYIGLIFMRKEILQRTQNKERYGPLGEVCRQYRDRLQKVCELYAQIESSGGKYRVARCREYLASCMLVDWLESGLYFHRACCIAAHLTGSYPQKQEPSEEAMDSFWYPVESLNDTQEIIKGYCEDGIHQISYPWDVLNYEEEIACVFAEPSPETERKCVESIVLREKYLQLWNLLSTVCPPEKQPQWTAELYLEAAKFFHDEYPVIEQFAAMEFPEVESVFHPLEEGQTRRRRRTLENDFYQNLERVFLSILDMDDSPLKFARRHFLAGG